MISFISFYEREVPSMSKVNSLKNEETNFNTFFKIFPFA